MRKPTYQTTIIACFIGYITQAIINNFIPLLFITFQNTYAIPLSKITLLVTINFGVQITVDLFASKFVDKIGYRVSILIAHIAAAMGLLLLTVLPDRMDPFTGILLSVTVYAIGGGIGFLLGVALAALYDRKIAKKQKTVYTITGYAMNTRIKGDNDLD